MWEKRGAESPLLGLYGKDEWGSGNNMTILFKCSRREVSNERKKKRRGWPK